MFKKLRLPLFIVIVFLTLLSGFFTLARLVKRASKTLPQAPVAVNQLNTELIPFIFEADFEDPDSLNDWSLTSTLPASVNSVSREQNLSDPLRNYSLKLVYAGSGKGDSYNLAEHPLGSDISGDVFVEFYDSGSGMDSLLISTVSKQDNTWAHYFGLGIGGAVLGKYLVDIDGQYYDSGISRSPGWHALIIHVTPDGTWADLDGTSLKNISSASITSFSLLAVENPDWGYVTIQSS